MIKSPITVASLALLGLNACTSHLMFVEEDNIGLKARFEANNPTPAQLSLGYRRGVVAVIPQQSKGNKPSPALSVASTNGAQGKVIVIKNDPNELMSLYTVFKANIGFNDPVAIKHFLATGTAATSLLADHDELRNVADMLKKADAQKGGDQ
jgi:hypothetical protein